MWAVAPNKVLNSLCKVKIILFQIILWREGIIQNIEGIINNPIKVLNQFNEKFMFVEGSNTENKLVIIFNLKMVDFFLIVCFLY